MLLLRLTFHTIIWFLIGIVCLIIFFPFALLALAGWIIDLMIIMSGHKEDLEYKRHKRMIDEIRELRSREGR